jgi:uncharacterized protein
MQRTALHAAATNGCIPAMQLLLEHGAAVDSVVVHGQTPLMLAAFSGHTAAAECLLNAGASLSHTDLQQRQALNCAVVRGHAQVVQLLIQRGAAKSCAAAASDGKLGRMPPLWCCAHVDTLQLLLSAGFDEHEGLKTKGRTCLHMAAQHGFPAPVVCLLLRAGVSAIAVNSAGHTAAQVAAQHGHQLAAALLARAARDDAVQSAA